VRRRGGWQVCRQVGLTPGEWMTGETVESDKHQIQQEARSVGPMPQMRAHYSHWRTPRRHPPHKRPDNRGAAPRCLTRARGQDNIIKNQLHATRNDAAHRVVLPKTGDIEQGVLPVCSSRTANKGITLSAHLIELLE